MCMGMAPTLPSFGIYKRVWAGACGLTDRRYLYAYQHSVMSFLSQVMGRNFSSFNESCAVASLNATSGGFGNYSFLASEAASQDTFVTAAAEDAGHYNDTAFASLSTQTRLYVIIVVVVVHAVMLCHAGVMIFMAQLAATCALPDRTARD